MKKTSSINQIINDARKGKMFILVDNKDRENEGDLVIPASKINPKKIRVILIECFNTKGLTGAFDKSDNDNYERFFFGINCF